MPKTTAITASAHPKKGRVNSPGHLFPSTCQTNSRKPSQHPTGASATAIGFNRHAAARFPCAN